jgi:hypothetical protein
MLVNSSNNFKKAEGTRRKAVRKSNYFGCLLPSASCLLSLLSRRLLLRGLRGFTQALLKLPEKPLNLWIAHVFEALLDDLYAARVAEFDEGFAGGTAELEIKGCGGPIEGFRNKLESARVILANRPDEAYGRRANLRPVAARSIANAQLKSAFVLKFSQA